MTPEQFLAFAQVFPEPLLLLDGKGHILAANTAQLRMLGLSRDAVVGNPLTDFVADPPEKVRSYLDACARSRAMVLGSLSFQTHEGHLIVSRCEGAVVRPWSKDAPATLLVRVQAKASAGRQFLLLNQQIEELSREIRERKRAEAEVFHQREQLRVTLSSIGDGVIATDVHSHVTFLNPVAEILTGWTQEEAIGKPLNEVFRIINEHSREPVENPVVQVLREGIIVGLANHTLLIAKDGTERAIADSGAPIRDERGALLGVVLVFRDVTEEHRTEQRQRLLAEVTAVLATSLDYETTLPAVLRLVVPLIADWCVAHVIGADGASRELAAVHVDANQEQQVYSAAGGPLADPHALYGVVTVMRTGQSQLLPVISDELLASFGQEAEQVQPLRSLHLTSLMVIPLSGREQTLGTLTFAMAESRRYYTLDDVTFAEELARRVTQAMENARLYQETQQAVRVRDTFISIAAHELRTPLTTLLGNAQLLVRRIARTGALSVTDQRPLQVITEQATRLNRMIHALLDISRLESGQLRLELTPVDLGILTRQVVDDVRPGLERHTMKCETPEAAVIVNGDVLRLEQVLHNLIGNAIKYSPKGGDVEVTVERRDDSACVIVRDEGIGIAIDEVPKLFERFYRANNVNPHYISGMGIGLFVVKEIIALHGGTVQVDSVEGVGSTFTICLPFSDGMSHP
jgi:PAS domain S-box-containing protein